MGKISGIILMILGILVSILFGMIIVNGLSLANHPQYVINWDVFFIYILILIGGIILIIFGIFLIIKDIKGGKKDIFGLTRAEKIKKAEEKMNK